MKVARDVPTVEVDRTPRTPGGGPDGVDLDEYVPAADSISARRKRLDDQAALARGEAVHRTAQRQHCQRQSACQPDEPRATLETHGVPPFPGSPATAGAVGTEPQRGRPASAEGHYRRLPQVCRDAFGVSSMGALGHRPGVTLFGVSLATRPLIYPPGLPVLVPLRSPSRSSRNGA